MGFHHQEEKDYAKGWIYILWRIISTQFVRRWARGSSQLRRGMIVALLGSMLLMPLSTTSPATVSARELGHVVQAEALNAPAFAPLAEVADDLAQAQPLYDLQAQATPTPTMPHPITYFIPSAVQPIEFAEGTINVALLGIDTRPQLKIKNTDVIVIASINPSIPAVTLLSIPRDTLVYIPGRFVWKANQAYVNGGFDLFKKTILYNFGIRIDHYAMVNFSAVVHAVEAVGGIDVVATCPIYHIFPKDPYYMGGPWLARDWTDNFSGEVWKAGTRVPTQTIDIPKPGIYQLNGLQALAYARARYGIPGGDVDRGRREQRVIRAIFAKSKQVGTLTKIPELLDTFNKDVQTDFALTDLLQLAGMADRINDTVIRSRFLDTGGANGALWTDARIYNGGLSNEFWRARRNYLADTLNVALNQRVNDSIAIDVLNGTNDPGFAAAAADRLGELGLRVVDIRPADTPYAQSAIIDYTSNSKGSALPMLQKTFNIKSANIFTAPATSEVKYTVVVGADFNTCYYAKSLVASGSEMIQANDNPTDTDAPLPDTVAVVAPFATDTPEATLTPEPTLTGVPTELPPLTPTVMATAASDSAAPLPTATLATVPTDVPTPTLAPDLPVVPVVPEATEAPIVKNAETNVFVMVPVGDYVNIRRGASTRTRIIGLLRSGQRAQIIGRSADRAWWQIRIGQRSGWVAAEFVRTSGDVAAVPVMS